MKLDKLWIGEFKNLRDVTVDFDESNLMTVIVGWNGSGKSNVIEALVIIFRDLDLGNPPAFAYELCYRIQNTSVRIIAKPAASKSLNDQYDIFVEWQTGGRLSPSHKISISEFRRKTGGVHLPKHVFAYYSGPSNRLESHFKDHQDRFYRDLLNYREGMEEPLRPLFYARPIHSQFVLLAFFLGEENRPREFLEKYLGIIGLDSVFFVMQKPEWAKHQQVKIQNIIKDFWGARGTVRTFLDRLYDVSLAPLQVIRRLPSEFKRQGTRKEFLYLFVQDLEALGFLAKGLTPATFFKMLESTYISDVLYEVRIRVKIRQIDGSLTFRELSEGEQQLLVVLGLLRFTGDADSLFLLDEPDTHLNPIWAVKYLSFLRDFVPNQDSSHIIMATHNPLAIAELEKGQVQVMWRSEEDFRVHCKVPDIDPNDLNYQEMLQSELFGIRSDLRPELLSMIERQRFLASKKDLTEEELGELDNLTEKISLEGYAPVYSDPQFAAFVKAWAKRSEAQKLSGIALTPDQRKNEEKLAEEILEEIIQEEKKQ